MIALDFKAIITGLFGFIRITEIFIGGNTYNMNPSNMQYILET